MIRFLLTGLFIFCANHFFLSGQNLKIGLFSDINTRSIVFSVAEGGYMVFADRQAIASLKKYDNVLFQFLNDSVECFVVGRRLGVFKKVELKSTSDSSYFGLRLVNPNVEIRYYDDNLLLFSALGKLQTINIVDIDKYVAGVVEAEGGTKAQPEYYKTQAVLCRTYALSHLDRHVEEDYHLCDGTHCQAYKGKSTLSTILYAARSTHNQVVVDPDSVFIIAAFYSNCGGTTENAENVWLINKPYLKSIKDPYCINSKNARWEYKMTLSDWKNYLIKNGFHISDKMSPLFFNSIQYIRKKFYTIGNDSITFQKIRTDLKLKSSFFSVEVKGSEVVLTGRGYGHGVGLCQEGAMQMAILGYEYNEIIKFYYRNVFIVDFSTLDKSKNQILQYLNR